MTRQEAMAVLNTLELIGGEFDNSKKILTHRTLWVNLDVGFYAYLWKSESDEEFEITVNLDMHGNELVRVSTLNAKDAMVAMAKAITLYTDGE